MEDFWKRAKTFAEEAAKKSQSLTTSSATSRIADLVSETTKKSKELAAEASKKAEEIKTAAIRQADQIKSFSDNISIPTPLPYWVLLWLALCFSFPFFHLWICVFFCFSLSLLRWIFVFFLV
jgi:ABC-type protease/lipase transport system fused ATPase/permease subunit